MAQSTLERLADRLAQAEKELEALDPQIASALASDASDAQVAKLRSRRRELVEQCDDLAEAMRFSESRGSDAKRQAEADKLNALRAEAKKTAEAFIANASAVDAALATVEAAFEKLKLSGLDLGRALRLAGLSDNSRIMNTLTPSLRWAAWKSAPAFSEQSQIPRAEFHRRKTMRDSAARVVPHIGDA